MSVVKSNIRKFILQEDIVIRKGAIFEDISNSTFWCGKNNLSGGFELKDLNARLVVNLNEQSKLFNELFERTNDNDCGHKSGKHGTGDI